jgi:hypothetical protein
MAELGAWLEATRLELGGWPGWRNMQSPRARKRQVGPFLQRPGIVMLLLR